jgi:mRNA interferase MazF
MKNLTLRSWMPYAKSSGKSACGWPRLRQSAADPDARDFYWEALDPTLGVETQKTRPIVIVSANPLNRARRTVVAVPVSTSAPAIQGVNVQLTGGSVARCDQVRTIDKLRLRTYMGTLISHDLANLSRGLARVMDLDVLN